MAQRTQYPIAVMLTSRDVKRTAAFYCDTLGFTLEQAWPDKDNPLWANYILDSQSVMFSAHGSFDDIEKMCAGNEDAIEYMKTLSAEFAKNQSGCGVFIYLQVPDVDAFHARVKAKGAAVGGPPKDQFYGQRDFTLQDPDGYRLVFYTQIKMSSCQSCGMPLTDAKPGELYCRYCTDDKGKLRPYEAIFEGTVTGYFMGMQKMARPNAEKAAREHLKKMPAWAGRV